MYLIFSMLSVCQFYRVDNKMIIILLYDIIIIFIGGKIVTATIIRYNTNTLLNYLLTGVFIYIQTD